MTADHSPLPGIPRHGKPNFQAGHAGVFGSHQRRAESTDWGRGRTRSRRGALASCPRSGPLGSSTRMNRMGRTNPSTIPRRSRAYLEDRMGWPANVRPAGPRRASSPGTRRAVAAAPDRRRSCSIPNSPRGRHIPIGPRSAGGNRAPRGRSRARRRSDNKAGSPSTSLSALQKWMASSQVTLSIGAASILSK